MPAFATLQATPLESAPVVRGVVSMPRRGAWTARLLVDSEIAPSGFVTLSTNEGAVSFVGSVVRGAAVYGRVEVLLVGGRHGLLAELPARAYRSIPARLVLEALLAEAGEELAPASDAGLLAQQLPAWTRSLGRASEGLDRLCAALGASWRINRAGQVLVTAIEAAPLSSSTGQLLEDAPGEGFRSYTLDRLDLEPGTTFDALPVAHVTHEITPERIRSRVWFA